MGPVARGGRESDPGAHSARDAHRCAPGGVEPTTVWPAWPLDRLIEMLQIGPGDTLVDAGCGRGELGLWIAGRASASLVGVEPSPVGRTLARERADREGSVDAVFVEGVLQRTGLADSTADAVMVVDVLHFVERDRGVAFREMARILRPGRRLVIVGPERSDPTDDLRAAGFDVEVRDETPGWREQVTAFAAALRREADSLCQEIGPLADDLGARAEQASREASWHGVTAARSS